MDKLYNSKPRLVFTGGGTAGHIMPSIALIQRLKFKYEIHYIGSYNSLEKDLVSKLEGVTFHPIPTVKLVRKSVFKNLLIPIKLLKAVRAAKKTLNEIRPAVIFSKGGYVALPVTLAAGRKYPYLVHESDMTMGLANKLAHKNAKHVLTAFDQTAAKFKNGVHTGLPLRQELFISKNPKSAQISKKNRPTLLVMGGSSGASAINNAIRAALPELLKSFNVIHLTGKGKPGCLTGLPRDSAKYEKKPRPNTINEPNKKTPPTHFNSLNSKEDSKLGGYIQIEFAHNMAKLYANADLVLSRGGATALFELTALKIPAVIVPLKKGASRGDQIQNAEYFQKKGLVHVLREENLYPETLTKVLMNCLNDSLLKSALTNAQNINGTEKAASLIISSANKIIQSNLEKISDRNEV